ncbi:MAG: FHA domain-containing protein [Lachnospiraceae bacterium]|nr:FHA domain-containing protein [Lachnospiraceae bacterium]
MNLSRCENGHFYDKEKYPTCPHCSGGSASDDSLTTVFTEGDVTEPAFPQPQPLPVAPSPVAPTADPGLPIAGFGVDEPTMPLPDNGPDTPTLPLEDIPTPASMPTEAGDDDDDHTVGFFDDDFFASPKTESVGVSPAAPPVVKAPVAKLGTPCVGWLIALGGAHIGTDFRLKVGKNFIGRSPQMDVALTEDKSVSRDRHAVVVYEPREHLYLVQPGEASTLVYRNEQVVLSPVKLEAYDVITVGDVNLLFMPLCNKEFNWNSVLEEMKNKAQR